jgi:signal transduction histidine kinase
LEEIISDLLDISKIEAGKLDFSFSRIGLCALVKKSLDALNHADHEIEFETPATEIAVNVDVQKMTQVFVNLLSNAIKYSSPGTKITLTAGQFGSEARFTITDQGIGILPEDIERIFSQFYRVNESKDNVQGIGLGLYISRQIVDGHLGRIWAESEHGKGSTFYVSFPVERS